MIPPLIIDSKIVTNFREANGFLKMIFFIYRTENRLSAISFKDEDILKIIKLLNVNKAYCHNNISIKLLQICAAEMVKTLSLISKGFIQYGIFSNLWKKSNIVPIHKKGNKQFMVNYCPVLLLPICEKIFERLIFNPVFPFLEENKLISFNQSVF